MQHNFLQNLSSRPTCRTSKMSWLNLSLQIFLQNCPLHKHPNVPTFFLPRTPRVISEYTRHNLSRYTQILMFTVPPLCHRSWFTSLLLLCFFVFSPTWFLRTLYWWFSSSVMWEKWDPHVRVVGEPNQEARAFWCSWLNLPKNSPWSGWCLL